MHWLTSLTRFFSSVCVCAAVCGCAQELEEAAKAADGSNQDGGSSSQDDGEQRGGQDAMDVDAANDDNEASARASRTKRRLSHGHAHHAKHQLIQLEDDAEEWVEGYWTGAADTPSAKAARDGCYIWLSRMERASWRECVTKAATHCRLAYVSTILQQLSDFPLQVIKTGGAILKERRRR